MSTDNITESAVSTNPPLTPATDASGNLVQAAETPDQAEKDKATLVDEVVSPPPDRANEQEAEELRKKTAEIERKVADGN